MSLRTMTWISLAVGVAGCAGYIPSNTVNAGRGVVREVAQEKTRCETVESCDAATNAVYRLIEVELGTGAAMANWCLGAYRLDEERREKRPTRGVAIRALYVFLASRPCPDWLDRNWRNILLDMPASTRAALPGAKASLPGAQHPPPSKAQ